MLFVVIGAVNAVDSNNVSNTEDSNLIKDDAVSLSSNNKLEISNEDSISQTNIVNSHDDNLGDCSEDEILCSEDSYGNNQSASSYDNGVYGDNTLSLSGSSTDSVAADGSSSDIVSAANSADSNSPVSTKLVVSDTAYQKSATYFTVTLSDVNGNPLSNQNVFLNVNKNTYSAYTGSDGKATIKTAELPVGSYSVKVQYDGNSNYSSYSNTQTVKVLSSIIGSDLTNYYGYTSNVKAQFLKGSGVLANTGVTFKINGKTYTAKTDNNGFATLKIKLSVGTYAVTIINPYTNEIVSHKIVVKKAKTAFSADSKKYIAVKKKSSFTVTLKDTKGRILKNKKITFTYAGKKVTSKTNEKGEATLSIPVLSKGTHKLKFKYKGSSNYYSCSGSTTLVVYKPTTKLSSSILCMNYKDGSKFKVKLTNSKNKALAKKTVKLKINDKIISSKTNSKGIAKFKVGDLTPGSHKVYYSYSKWGTKSYSYGSNYVAVIKAKAVVSAKNLVMNPNDGSTYNVVVKDKSGKLLKDVYVNSVINGKTYTYKTNSEGVAKFSVDEAVGYHSIKTYVSDPCYKSSSVTKHITVKGNKFVASNKYVSPGTSSTFSVKLVNERDVAVANADVQFIFEGKTSNVKTDGNGIAKVKLDALSQGTHQIKYTFGSVSGSSKLYVINKVTINDILTASKKVKKYISKNSQLPSTVKVGDVKVSSATFTYLASKAIVKLKAGKTSGITFKNVGSPSNPKKATNLGYLSNYLSVAKKIVKTAESKGKMPNSVSSKVGTIGYDGVVSALARVLVSYNSHKKMPSTVKVKSLSGSSSLFSTNALNTKNTIKNLVSYLAASKNCEVNNAQIKKIVKKITKKCTSEKDKANAIFKYVRDTISYSFYFNTKHGAAGTLSAKSGNCVDHAHLLVAMFRAAGMPSRYVHAKCTFSSGHTYGHVWAQVLIGNTWTIADATSSRNSLGHVANWNTHSFKLQGYFQSISF